MQNSRSALRCRLLLPPRRGISLPLFFVVEEILWLVATITLLLLAPFEIFVFSEAADIIVLPCQSPLTVAGLNNVFILEDCWLSNTVAVAVDISGFTNVTIRRSLIGAITLQPSRDYPLTATSVTIEDCTWRPEFGSGAAMTTGDGTLVSGSLPPQLWSIRRCAIALPLDATLLSIPSQQAGTTTWTVAISDSNVTGSGWVPLVTIATKLTHSHVTFDSTNVTWALPGLPFPAPSFQWLHATSMGDQSSWSMVRCCMKVDRARSTTGPLPSSDAITKPITMVNLPTWGNLGTLNLTSCTLSFHAGLLESPSGALSLLKTVLLSLGALHISNCSLIANHTVLSTGSIPWTSVIALSLGCNGCARFQVCDNNAVVGGNLERSSSDCTYAAQTYVTAVFLQTPSPPITTTTTAIMDRNTVRMVLTVLTASYYCGYRTFAFTGFEVRFAPSDISNPTGGGDSVQSSASVRLQHNLVHVHYDWHNTGTMASVTRAVSGVLAKLTSNCAGLMNYCFGVVMHNNITSTISSNDPYMYAAITTAIVSVMDNMNMFPGGNVNVTRNVLRVVPYALNTSDLLLLPPLLPAGGVSDGNVAADDVVRIWADSVLDGLLCREGDVVSRPTAWFVCGNVADMISTTTSSTLSVITDSTLCGSRTAIARNTAAVWGLAGPETSFGSATLSIAHSTNLLGGNIRNNVIACNSSFSVTARVVSASSISPAPLAGDEDGPPSSEFTANVVNVVSMAESYETYVSSAVSLVEGLTVTTNTAGPLYITNNNVRALATYDSLQVGQQASLLSGTLSLGTGGTSSIRHNFLLMEDNGTTSEGDDDRGDVDCVVVSDDGVAFLVCNNTVRVLRLRNSFKKGAASPLSSGSSSSSDPSSSASSEGGTTYCYVSISAYLSLVGGSFSFLSSGDRVDLMHNWAVMKAARQGGAVGGCASSDASSSGSGGEVVVVEGELYWTLTWVQSCFPTGSSSNSVLIEKNLAYVMSNSNSDHHQDGDGPPGDHQNLINTYFSFLLCESVALRSNSPSSRTAAVVTKNSVLAFTESNGYPHPPTGTRPTGTAGPINCQQEVLPALARWTRSILTSPTLFVCDNHLYADVSSFKANFGFVRSVSLSTTTEYGGTFPSELYVVDNYVEVIRLSVLTRSSSPFSLALEPIYVQLLLSSSIATIFPLAVIADNGYVAHGLPNGSSVSVSLLSLQFSYGYALGPRSPSIQHVICNNTIFASSLLPHDNPPTTEAARTCPTLTDTVRTVVCNNTIRLFNTSADLAVSWVSQLYMDVSRYQATSIVSSTDDTITVAHNDISVSGASSLSATLVSYLSGVQLFHLNVLRNTLQAVYTTGSVDVNFLGSSSMTGFGRPFAVESNNILFTCSDAEAAGAGDHHLPHLSPPSCDTSGLMAMGGGGGLVHICGNRMEIDTTHITEVLRAGVADDVTCVISVASTSLTFAGNSGGGQLLWVTGNTIGGILGSSVSSVSIRLLDTARLSIYATSYNYLGTPSVMLSGNRINLTQLLNGTSASNRMPSVSITAVSTMEGSVYWSSGSVTGTTEVASVAVSLRFVDNLMSVFQVPLTIDGGAVVAPPSSSSLLATLAIAGVYRMVGRTSSNYYWASGTSRVPSLQTAELVALNNTITTSAFSANVWALFSAVGLAMVSSVSVASSAYASVVPISFYSHQQFNVTVQQNRVLFADGGGVGGPFTASPLRLSMTCAETITSYYYTGGVMQPSLVPILSTVDVQDNVLTFSATSVTTQISSVGVSFVEHTMPSSGTTSTKNVFHVRVRRNTLAVHGTAAQLDVQAVSYISGTFVNGTALVNISNNSLVVNATNATGGITGNVLGKLSSSAVVEQLCICSNTIELGDVSAFGGLAGGVPPPPGNCCGSQSEASLGGVFVSGNVMNMLPLTTGWYGSVDMSIASHLSITGIYLPTIHRVQRVLVQRNEIRGVLHINPCVSWSLPFRIATVMTMQCSLMTSMEDNPSSTNIAPPDPSLVLDANMVNVTLQYTSNFSNVKTSLRAVSIMGISALSATLTSSSSSSTSLLWVPLSRIHFNITGNTLVATAGPPDTTAVAPPSSLRGLLFLAAVVSIYGTITDSTTGLPSGRLNPQVRWVTFSVQSNVVRASVETSPPPRLSVDHFLSSVGVVVVQSLRATSTSSVALTTTGILFNNTPAAHYFGATIDNNTVRGALVPALALYTDGTPAIRFSMSCAATITATFSPQTEPGQEGFLASGAPLLSVILTRNVLAITSPADVRLLSSVAINILGRFSHPSGVLSSSTVWSGNAALGVAGNVIRAQGSMGQLDAHVVSYVTGAFMNGTLSTVDISANTISMSASNVTTGISGCVLFELLVSSPSVCVGGNRAQLLSQDDEQHSWSSPPPPPPPSPSSSACPSSGGGGSIHMTSNVLIVRAAERCGFVDVALVRFAKSSSPSNHSCTASGLTVSDNSIRGNISTGDALVIIVALMRQITYTASDMAASVLVSRNTLVVAVEPTSSNGSPSLPTGASVVAVDRVSLTATGSGIFTAAALMERNSLSLRMIASPSSSFSTQVGGARAALSATVSLVAFMASSALRDAPQDVPMTVSSNVIELHHDTHLNFSNSVSLALSASLIFSFIQKGQVRPDGGSYSFPMGLNVSHNVVNVSTTANTASTPPLDGPALAVSVGVSLVKTVTDQFEGHTSCVVNSNDVAVLSNTSRSPVHVTVFGVGSFEVTAASRLGNKTSFVSIARNTFTIIATNSSSLVAVCGGATTAGLFIEPTALHLNIEENVALGEASRGTTSTGSDSALSKDDISNVTIRMCVRCVSSTLRCRIVVSNNSIDVSASLPPFTQMSYAAAATVVDVALCDECTFLLGIAQLSPWESMSALERTIKNNFIVARNWPSESTNAASSSSAVSLYGCRRCTAVVVDSIILSTNNNVSGDVMLAFPTFLMMSINSFVASSWGDVSVVVADIVSSGGGLPSSVDRASGNSPGCFVRGNSVEVANVSRTAAVVVMRVECLASGADLSPGQLRLARNIVNLREAVVVLADTLSPNVVHLSVAFLEVSGLHVVPSARYLPACVMRNSLVLPRAYPTRKCPYRLAGNFLSLINPIVVALNATDTSSPRFFISVDDNFDESGNEWAARANAFTPESLCTSTTTTTSVDPPTMTSSYTIGRVASNALFYDNDSTTIDSSSSGEWWMESVIPSRFVMLHAVLPSSAEEVVPSSSTSGSSSAPPNLLMLSAQSGPLRWAVGVANNSLTGSAVMIAALSPQLINISLLGDCCDLEVLIINSTTPQWDVAIATNIPHPVAPSVAPLSIDIVGSNSSLGSLTFVAADSSASAARWSVNMANMTLGGFMIRSGSYSSTASFVFHVASCTMSGASMASSSITPTTCAGALLCIADGAEVSNLIASFSHIVVSYNTSGLSILSVAPRSTLAHALVSVHGLSSDIAAPMAGIGTSNTTVGSLVSIQAKSALTNVSLQIAHLNTHSAQGFVIAAGPASVLENVRINLTSCHIDGLAQVVFFNRTRRSSEVNITIEDSAFSADGEAAYPRAALFVIPADASDDDPPCPFDQTVVFMDSVRLYAFPYASVGTLMPMSPPTLAASVPTRSNVRLLMACVQWSMDPPPPVASLATMAQQDPPPNVFPRGAFTPLLTWWPLYEPLCASRLHPEVTCPCNLGTPTITQSQSLSLPIGPVPPCPSLRAAPNELSMDALQFGGSSVAFSIVFPSSNIHFSLPPGDVAPSSYVSWSVRPQPTSAGSLESTIGQQGGFAVVNTALITCTITSAVTLNCSLPPSPGAADGLGSEIVTLQLAVNMFSAPCHVENGGGAASFVLHPGEPSDAVLAVKVISSIAVATSLASAMSASAVDGQVLAAIAGMSCASSAAQEASGPLQYLISPFYDLGPIAVVLGNMLLSISFFSVRLALTRMLPDKLPPTTLRFPSVDLAVAMFLMQGVVGAGGRLLFTFPSAGEGLLGLVSMVYAGLVFGFSLCASFKVRPFIRFILYPHSCSSHIATTTTTAEDAAAPARGSTSTTVKERWLLPSGYWRPKRLTRALGGTFARTSAVHNTHFSLFPSALSMAVTLLASIQPPKSGCTTQISIIALLFFASAGVQLRWWPVRIPATNVFVIATYLSMGLLLVLYAVGVYHGSITLELAKVYLTMLQTFLMIARSIHDLYAKGFEYCYLRPLQEPDDSCSTEESSRSSRRLVAAHAQDDGTAAATRRRGAIRGFLSVLAAWLLDEDIATTEASSSKKLLDRCDECEEEEGVELHLMPKEGDTKNGSNSSPGYQPPPLYLDDDDDISSIDLDGGAVDAPSGKSSTAVVDVNDTEEEVAMRAAESLRRKAALMDDEAADDLAHDQWSMFSSSGGRRIRERSESMRGAEALEGGAVGDFLEATWGSSTHPASEDRGTPPKSNNTPRTCDETPLQNDELHSQSVQAPLQQQRIEDVGDDDDESPPPPPPPPNEDDDDGLETAVPTASALPMIAAPETNDDAIAL